MAFIMISRHLSFKYKHNYLNYFLQMISYRSIFATDENITCSIQMSELITPRMPIVICFSTKNSKLTGVRN